MSWVRIDDGFADHPKIVAAGPICAIIQVRAFCYAARHLTDGVLPAAVIPSLLVGFDHLGIETGGVPGLVALGRDVDEFDWPAAMCHYALWEPCEGGFRVHDYLDYNPSRRHVVADRRNKQRAGKIGGKASAAGRASSHTPAQAPASASAHAPARRPLKEVLNSPSPSPESTSTPGSTVVTTAGGGAGELARLGGALAAPAAVETRDPDPADATRTARLAFLRLQAAALLRAEQARNGPGEPGTAPLAPPHTDPGHTAEARNDP